ncbi:MAG TPA: MraY family glycosyltransferase [Acidimicrobiia bacterium]|nr:MraY family glycosyltransferase [Acidimicrobiia bacterium]
MAEYLLVLAVAALVTWLLTPAVRRAAIRLGAVVSPDSRRVHERPTPTLGGAAMYGGFLAAMALASVLPKFRPVFRGTSEPLGLLIGATTMFAVGALDDLREVSPPAKLAGQVFSGSLLSLLGVTLLFFRIPFAGFVVLSPDLSPLLTVIWVALMANAVNLIDGLDGLAAGVVAIAGAAFFLYSLRLSDSGLLAGSNLAPLVAIIAVGVCVGFLPHNAHPARIFMGDAGALFLGLLLAASTIVVGGRTADQFSGQTFFFFAPLVIPFVILGVPMLDIALAIVRRAVRRTSIALPDKDHLHHRLMRLGHGQRRTVFLLWAWTAVLAGFVLAPTYTNEGNALVPFGIAGLALVLYAIFHPTAREARRAALEATIEVAVDAEEPGAPNGSGTNGAGNAEVVVLIDPGDELEEPRPPRATSWPA